MKKYTKHYRLNIDTIPLDFGKYRGMTPEAVSAIDPSYIVWLYDTVKPPACSKHLRDESDGDRYDEDYEYELDIHFGLDGW
jgi:hypothetical protein